MTPANLVLRPNCLLTKSPFVFLSGPRSLFSPQKMASPVQDFIQAHGYVVTPIALPFRELSLRKTALKNWFRAHANQKFHVVLAGPTAHEFKTILDSNVSQIVSLTLVCAKTSEFGEAFRVDPTPLSKIPLSYRLHQSLSRALNHQAIPYEETLLRPDPVVLDRFLDHCVELAENEIL